MITQDRLKELLRYEPETGEFRWIAKWKPRDRVAGCIKPGNSWEGGGYRMIRVDKRLYRASHLAWLYVKGCLPAKRVDHRDNDRLNDRIDNLREATGSQNNVNSKSRPMGATGLRGVTYDKARGLFASQISIGNKHVYLGRFGTAEEAHAAYRRRARQVYGEFMPDLSEAA